MNLFQNYLATEFAEDYYEGLISRREALRLIASITGSAVLASTILAACAPNESPTSTPVPLTGTPTTAGPSATVPGEEPTMSPPGAAPTQEPTRPVAGTVNPDDPAILAGPVEFPGKDATLLGYQARPQGDGPFPVILVCHENRGLTEHIQDVARRLARVGCIAMAVDLLSRQGGSAAVGVDQAPAELSRIDPNQFVEDFLSAWQFLQGQVYADTARVGMVGFCFGGGITWQVAVKMPELKAAVPFYGPHPLPEDVATIKAAVLAIYGERDTRINSGIPAIEEAMKQNQKIYEKVIYPGADHAFHNDTGPRYNPEAARDAWARTLKWFEMYV